MSWYYRNEDNLGLDRLSRLRERFLTLPLHTVIRAYAEQSSRDVSFEIMCRDVAESCCAGKAAGVAFLYDCFFPRLLEMRDSQQKRIIPVLLKAIWVNWYTKDLTFRPALDEAFKSLLSQATVTDPPAPREAILLEDEQFAATLIFICCRLRLHSLGSSIFSIISRDPTINTSSNPSWLIEFIKTLKNFEFDFDFPPFATFLEDKLRHFMSNLGPLPAPLRSIEDLGDGHGRSRKAILRKLNLTARDPAHEEVSTWLSKRAGIIALARGLANEQARRDFFGVSYILCPTQFRVDNHDEENIPYSEYPLPPPPSPPFGMSDWPSSLSSPPSSPRPAPLPPVSVAPPPILSAPAPAPSLPWRQNIRRYDEALGSNPGRAHNLPRRVRQRNH
ncbi:hypothetical protein SISSUDRAFT_1121413 [Sistotremastrum suecicum HHB10207 ss-3]|uniref:Uncharacterized protein n=1 Tax=Sistotremastrum suecicum HHB10207 ss-3 TaxID=1314776 RepID=A0A166AV69_9AGAM|nr:hypothetical protein SISSUDRAFT_1121413 [Sistotremastrum suecicum HHB10207 ss-3]